MIFDFNPWQLDVDIDLTKQLYKEADYSTNKTSNLEFIKSLSSEQQMFFNSLGVDLSKVEVDKTIYEIPEDEKIASLKNIENVCQLSNKRENTGIAKISKRYLLR